MMLTNLRLVQLKNIEVIPISNSTTHNSKSKYASSFQAYSDKFNKQKGQSYSKGDSKSGKGDFIKFQKLNMLYNELMVKDAKGNRLKTAVIDEVFKSTSGILTQVGSKMNNYLF